MPSGDLFRAIREGKASVVTDRIETFTARGVRLASGEELEADIIVTATGLRLQAFGGIDIYIDGERVDVSQKIAFRGMMLDGVPNLAFLIGYTNASWTLKVGLVCEHFCRLLAHMDEAGIRHLPWSSCPIRTWRRARCSTSRPATCSARCTSCRARARSRRGSWPMSFRTDARVLRDGPVEDPNLRFARTGDRDPAADQVLTATSLTV